MLSKIEKLKPIIIVHIRNTCSYQIFWILSEYLRTLETRREIKVIGYVSYVGLLPFGVIAHCMTMSLMDRARNTMSLTLSLLLGSYDPWRGDIALGGHRSDLQLRESTLRGRCSWSCEIIVITPRLPRSQGEVTHGSPTASARHTPAAPADWRDLSVKDHQSQNKVSHYAINSTYRNQLGKRAWRDRST